jgi:hypothetical protein
VTKSTKALSFCLKSLPWCLVASIFGLVSWARDTGYGGPHHDEVIAMLATGGRERTFADMYSRQVSPFYEVVEARQWHLMTHDYDRLPLDEIRRDVMFGDKHPPLAFWILNHWLSLFEFGGYREAVWHTWTLLLMASGILAATVFRYTRHSRFAFIAFSTFLLGNSAVYTGTWVRQYAFFILCYAVLIAASGEIVRRRLSQSLVIGLTILIGLSCVCGMMTQYTYLTMSAPVHVMILVMLVRCGLWSRLLLVGAGYCGAGVLFFWCMPGVIEHASVVSGQMEKKMQLYDAFFGVPQMYIPMPTSLPPAVILFLSLLGMAVPCFVWWNSLQNTAKIDELDGPDLRVPLSGILGAGVLQFALVALGYYPGWATGPNHLCALWLLTVLGVVIWVSRWSARKLQAVVFGTMATSLLFMQVLYAWHCHRILPRVNTSYIQSQSHDLVAIDNLARGFVLQITDLIPDNEKVLATDSKKLAARLSDGSLDNYRSILYLPMDISVRDGKASVIAAAERSGWKVNELPVVHTGLYEAIMLERSPESSDDTR